MSFRWFINWMMVEVYKNFLCRHGLHWNNYYSETHKVSGIDHLGITELNVPIRECECCGRRQHHLRPRHQGFSDWQPFSYDLEEEMKLTTR